MKARKGFLKGMVKDSTRTKFQDDSYYHLKNFRVVTEDGLSTGSLENEKGHILGFKIPDIPARTYANNAATYNIPAQSNLKIVGWGNMNDTIIILTTNETSDTPNGIGQVWAFKFDETTGTIIDSVNNVLDETAHLKYNNKLNLSTHYRIARVIGRYENSKTQRIYWTDNYSPVRTLNIADPESISLDPGSLDLSPGTSLVQPVVWDVGNGGLPCGVSIQFTYRLLSTAGASSLYAPPTPIIPLPESGYNVASLSVFNGNGVSSTLNRSVTLKITGLDTTYDVIEHVAILYNNFGVATAYKYDEAQVPVDGNLQIVCTSLLNAEVIPLVELNVLSSGFEVAKDIEVKDNLLIAANTKSFNADFDFDARVYRFNSNREAKLEDSTVTDEITISGVTKNITSPNPTLTGTWLDIPEEHDCINPYNYTDEQGPAVWNNNQYKYQADGVNLGGEGPNIKYWFVTEPMMANNNINDTPSGFEVFPHISVNKWPAGTLTQTGIIERNGTLQEYNRSNQFYNMASFTNHAYFAGHARGEVYRYGITFYNNKGSVAFTKWIGDIRIPEVTEGFPIQNNDGSQVGFSANDSRPWLQSLGIAFEVNTSSINSEITGFSFVRVLRDEPSRTRMGSGMLMWYETRFENKGSSILSSGNIILSGEDEDDLYNVWKKNFLLDSGITTNQPQRTTDSRLNLAGVRDMRFTLRDRPKWGFDADSTPIKKAVTHFISPLGKTLPITTKQGDYIKTLGYYNARCNKYGDTTATTLTPNFREDSIGFHYKLNNYITASHNVENIEIEEAITLNYGQIASGLFKSKLETPPYSFNHLLCNASYGASNNLDNPANFSYRNIPWGIGEKKLTMLLSLTPSKPWMISASSIQHDMIGSHNTPTWTSDFSNGINSDNKVYFKQVYYCRFVANQYGGRTYEDRSTNNYIYIGHFQPKVNGITSYINRVFLGDTYVNYYDTEYISAYNSTDDVPLNIYDPQENDRNKLSIAVCCPVESPINTEFRPTKQWSKDRQGAQIKQPTMVAGYLFSATDYNYAYNNYDFVNNKFFPKDFLSTLTEEQPNRIWASRLKINGELVDSWRVFDPNEYTEVNGVLGPINRIINWREQLYYYQDKGIGTASINERSIVNDNSGQSVVLGTGGVLSDYRYLSTETGSVHQHSIAATPNALYHYDARLKKIYQNSGNSLSPLSDLKGMSSWFDEEVKGAILDNDKTTTTLGLGAIGVHAVPDFRYNRVLFTFLRNKNIKEFSRGETYYPGDVVKGVLGQYYEFTQEWTYTVIGNTFLLAPPVNVTKLLEDTGNFGFTVSYNENLQAFEGFYDYIPNMYLQYGRRLLSNNPFNSTEAYIHNEGEYGFYYNRKHYSSSISTVLGTQGEQMKLFSNLNYYGEVTSNGNDIYDESFNRIRMYNDYQDTGVIDLVPSNLKRRMRTWRYTIPRDQQSSKARLRNFWLMLDLEYDNNNNKRHIVHDLIYSYMPVSM